MAGTLPIFQSCPACGSREHVHGKDWSDERSGYLHYKCGACGYQWDPLEHTPPHPDRKSNTAGLQMKYFVMKPHGNTPYTHASRIGILAYAEAITPYDPQLAADLIEWIEEENE